MKKIVSVGLNPAYDFTLQVDDFSINTVCRVQKDYYQVAGKGADVAYYMAQLGGKVTVTGFLGQDNSGGFQKFYKKHDIVDASIITDGHIRTNVIVLGEDESVTNLNSAGRLQTAPHWDEMMGTIRTLAVHNDMFVVSGSLCEDNPIDAYYTIIKTLKQAGKVVYFDSSGDALKNGIKAKPDFIKPNYTELCDFVGVDSLTTNEIIMHAKALYESGIAYVCISLGADGLIMVCGDGVYKAVPKKVIKFVSTVGAGDAFVAGFAFAQAQDKGVVDSIMLGCALSRAVIKTVGPRVDSVEAVMDNMKNISVTKIDFV